MRGESLSPGVSPGAGPCTVEDPRGHTNEMTMCLGAGEEDAKRSEVTSKGHSASLLWWEIRKGFRLKCCLGLRGNGSSGSDRVKCGKPQKEETSDISGYCTGEDD